MYYAKSSEKRHKCYSCQEELIFDTKIGRRDMCPNCSAYLHCCLNCEHHDKNVHNECKENQGEFIRDRSEGNFCLYFEFMTLGEDGESAGDAARNKLNSLFGGGGGDGPKKPTLGDFVASPKTAEDARSKLEDLFKK
ncbi:MAG: hypothetical protein ACI9WU_001393 [Myxococcota bacterium]|jgi:hypothetical protein